MPVEDVFSITGRGTVATGRIDRGKIKVGEEVEMVGFGTDKKTVVTGVEMFRKLLDDGQAGGEPPRAPCPRRGGASGGGAGGGGGAARRPTPPLLATAPLVRD